MCILEINKVTLFSFVNTAPMMHIALQGRSKIFHSLIRSLCFCVTPNCEQVSLVLRRFIAIVHQQRNGPIAQYFKCIRAQKLRVGGTQAMQIQDAFNFGEKCCFCTRSQYDKRPQFCIVFMNALGREATAPPFNKLFIYKEKVRMVRTLPYQEIKRK